MFTKESIKDFHQTGRVLFSGSNFMYLLPHPVLRTWISNYTITFPSAGMMSDQYTVLPHGSATLVFSCVQNSINSSLFGPITKPAQVGHEANASSLLFIVEFQPAGYYAFSGIPQNELTNFVLSFNDVNPSLHKLIAQKLEESSSIESFIWEMDRLFMCNLKIASYQQEFSLANHLIKESGGSLSVKELSQEVFYSQRHLSRIFDKYMGINTKSFSSLVRVNKALRLLRRPGCSIQQACMLAGFYDTSHFIHDCKSMCGITPQEYRNNMSDFYNEIAKF